MELQQIIDKYVTTYEGGGKLIRLNLMSEEEKRIYCLSVNPNYFNDSGETDEERYKKRKEIERDNRIRVNEYQFLNSK